mgnify:CR=1 FL=1
MNEILSMKYSSILLKKQDDYRFSRVSRCQLGPLDTYLNNNNIGKRVQIQLTFDLTHEGLFQ